MGLGGLTCKLLEEARKERKPVSCLVLASRRRPAPCSDRGRLSRLFCGSVSPPLAPKAQQHVGGFQGPAVPGTLGLGGGGSNRKCVLNVPALFPG